MNREGFVGVHIGAGQHAESRTELYLKICAEACKVAIEELKKGSDALEAACKATMILEDAGETNAGYGSNLTESGTVEMDAGIMDGNSLLFGAVGAMPGIKNPIHVARLLVQEQQKGLLPLGRVPPGFLVGQGAHDWAVRHGVEAVDSKSLISEKANKLYRHYKKKLDAFRQSVGNHLKRKTEETDNYSPSDAITGFHNSSQSSSKSGSPNYNSTIMPSYSTVSPNYNIPEQNGKVPRLEKHSMDDSVTDTVGVVVMDSTGNVASTVSSGGIALKQPGRVGQASCFGCGCWAQRARASQGKPYTVGISTTGCGEHLVRTFLARECALELNRSANPVDALQKVMKEKFAESEFLYGVPEKLGGAICMHYDEISGAGEFLWTHTTSSMGIAFQTTADEQATTRMSRLNGCTEPNTTSILVEGVPFSTIPKNTVISNEINHHWKKDVSQLQLSHPHPLQRNRLDGDCLESSNEVSGLITAVESAKA